VILGVAAACGLYALMLAAIVGLLAPGPVAVGLAAVGAVLLVVVAGAAFKEVASG
jgi:hypothetical protein